MRGREKKATPSYRKAANEARRTEGEEERRPTRLERRRMREYKDGGPPREDGRGKADGTINRKWKRKATKARPASRAVIDQPKDDTMSANKKRESVAATSPCVRIQESGSDKRTRRGDDIKPTNQMGADR